LSDARRGLIAHASAVPHGCRTIRGLALSAPPDLSPTPLGESPRDEKGESDGPGPLRPLRFVTWRFEDAPANAEPPQISSRGDSPTVLATGTGPARNGSDASAIVRPTGGGAAHRTPGSAAGAGCHDPPVARR
jgi:hypothetical protein